jgi:hypothetical protein
MPLSANAIRRFQTTFSFICNEPNALLQLGYSPFFKVKDGRNETGNEYCLEAYNKLIPADFLTS